MEGDREDFLPGPIYAGPGPRETALDRAVRAMRYDERPEDTVKRAQAYYEFLIGDKAT